MPVLTSGLWKQEPNTKISALTHWLSYRATFTSVAATNTLTLSLPSNYVSPGQLPPVSGNPAASAPTYTNPDVNSEPQAGIRLILSRMVVRDITPGAVQDTTSGTSVRLQSNVGGSFANTPLSATLPTMAQNNASLGNYVICDEASGPSGSYTSGSQQLIINPSLGQTVQFVVTAGTAGTAGNNGGFTVDLFGHWAQGF